GFESDKVRALLAYLAVEANRPHRREKLAGLLWPDWTERAARTNLRRVLSNLRTTIRDRVPADIADGPPSFLHASQQTIQLSTGGDAWVDVLAFKGRLGSRLASDTHGQWAISGRWPNACSGCPSWPRTRGRLRKLLAFPARASTSTGPSAPGLSWPSA
ncbi:MAG: hypothetical protein PVF47_20035, partial [Anaerolineae bacterium]